MTSGDAGFVLVEYDPRFLQDLYGLRSDAHTQALLLSPMADIDTAQTESWIKRRLDEQTTVFWLVLDDDTHEFIGFVQFTDLHRLHQRCEMGIALAPNVRGRGYGKKILKQAIAKMKMEHNVTKFSVHARADHWQAIRLYEDLKFNHVGICRQHYKIASEWIDVILMELVD